MLLSEGPFLRAMALLPFVLGFITSCHASLVREAAPDLISPSLFYDALGTRLFDPQGRVLQLEYALEATKKGGAAVGAVSGHLGVIASWSPRLSGRQCKASQQETRGIWRGDSHVAMAGSGMVTDAMVLVDMARRECLSHRYIYSTPVRLNRLMTFLQKEMYETERNRVIPFAVDLLVCGADECGTYLYNIGPASVYESFQAYAVGHKADAAKTYMSSRLDEMSRDKEASLRELISLVLRTLVKTFPQATTTTLLTKKINSIGMAVDEEEMTEDICLAVVGKDLPVTELKVSWDPTRRRLEVTLPAELAQL